MSAMPPRRNTPQGAVAGALILGGMALGLLVGLAVGALVGAVAPLVVAGLLLGFAGGIWAVIVRFRDL